MGKTWQRPSTAPALMSSRWKNLFVFHLKPYLLLKGCIALIRAGGGMVFIILKGGGMPQRGGCSRPFQVGGWVLG